jgi:hypothetical protein
MRFVWLQMFNLEHCRPGHAESSSQRWRPQPALTELACVAGAMASLCRRWRDRVCWAVSNLQLLPT